MKYLTRYVKPRPENIINNIFCLDLEATCDSPNQLHPQEIIEIASHKIDLKSKSQPLISFHSFVRPKVYPKLTSFCKQMTGISQSDVDETETLDKVYVKMIHWIDEQNSANEKFAFATCGNSDMHYLVNNCKLFDIELPSYFKQWIDIKKSFFNHKKIWPTNLSHMLEVLELRQEGKLHSAKDDSLNLARVVKKLHDHGYEYHLTNSMK